MSMWMVRAERGGALYDDFLLNGHVTIGWSKAGDLSDVRSGEDAAEKIARGYDVPHDRAMAGAGGVLHRFASGIATGDHVVTYDPSARVYAIGTVTGPYRHDTTRPVLMEDNPHPHVRPVNWIGELSRDVLSTTARNTLGAMRTIFAIKPKVADELLGRLRGEKVAHLPTPLAAPGQVAIGNLADTEDGPDEADVPTAAALEEQAMTGIADLVTAISPDDMEQFVAGLLRALGYHARVSPKGPDRGRDILATPDPLGLEDPRIHVEVKHRAGKASPGMIRSFLGGRGPGDRGIFVSTGGFTREARYEADRASIPVQLLDIEDLVRLLIENYGKLKPDIARMVPLRRIWWPH